MDERGSSPGVRGGNPAERGSGVDERGSSPGGRGGGGGERGDRAGGRGGGGGGESGGGRGVVEGRRVKVGGGELRVTRWIGRGLYRTFARVTVTGEVPATGAVLLAVNHTALVDGPLLYGVLPRPVAFLTKAEVFWGPLGLLLRYTQQIAVHRGAAERAPLLAALGFLRAGGVVGVFPEGTRGDGNVAEVQHGIAYLAVRSGAPVVPVAVHGTAARRGREFFRPHRPPVLVAFGPPLRVPSGAASRRTVAAAAVEIHRTLAAHVSDTRPHPEEELS
jgi:1-acyl-sn-glycerol-3-phosphate acyltransferase